MIDLKKDWPAIQTAEDAVYRTGNAVIQCAGDAVINVAEGAEVLFGACWHKSDPFPSLLVLNKGAKITAQGSFKIYSGARLCVNKGAELILGSGYINNGLNLHCYKRIEIGEGVAIADNVSIRDSDNHRLSNAPDYEMSRPIRIGNRVWIGMNATILKGVTINEGAVVAAGAVVTKDVPARCLVAGVPARVIRREVEWE